MLQSWNGDLAALQAVFGGVRMPVILADAQQDDHPIVFANQAFLDLTGYSREEVLGRNCRFLQGEEADPETLARIRAALAQGQPISIDVVNYRADGVRFWNALFIGPVFDDAGELRYYLGNQLDVTAQKDAEEALHQMRKTEAIGQVATGLAQALSNQLQVVIGALELMAPKFHDAGVSRHGARALRGARDAADLVHQLLAFARKAPLAPRSLELTSAVQRVQAASGGRRRRPAVAPGFRQRDAARLAGPHAVRSRLAEPRRQRSRVDSKRRRNRCPRPEG